MRYNANGSEEPGDHPSSRSLSIAGSGSGSKDTLLKSKICHSELQNPLSALYSFPFPLTSDNKTFCKAPIQPGAEIWEQKQQAYNKCMPSPAHPGSPGAPSRSTPLPARHQGQGEPEGTGREGAPLLWVRGELCLPPDSLSKCSQRQSENAIIIGKIESEMTKRLLPLCSGDGLSLPLS